MSRPILIAGPTASGKSSLALALAVRFDGVVINADSMQVYCELPVLTAQPSAAERSRVPHRLYGHVPVSEAYSTGRYLVDVAVELQRARAAGKRPIIVGGTGLYFKALLEGLSPVPSVPTDVRERWRSMSDAYGAGAVWQALVDRDPVMAARLDPNDTQRIVRALEVHEATGRSLAEWQAVAGEPLLAVAACVTLRVERTRDDLRARSDQRFDLMMAAGALDEIRALAGQSLSPQLPAMRALGVGPLLAHLRGERALAAAVEQAKLETRQYIKRQETWLRRNMIAWRQVTAQQLESIDVDIDAVV